MRVTDDGTMVGAIDDAPHHAAVGAGAFDAFYRDAYQDMVRMAYAMVGSRETAEDLVQDAFVAVQRRWRSIGEPLHYTRRAVANKCRSFHRRRYLERNHAKRRRPAEHAEMHPSELSDVLNRLPMRQRQAIVLRYYEDLSEEQTARIIGCRPATVRSLLHRAMPALRAALDERRS